MGRILGIFAIALGVCVALIAAFIAYRLWSGGQVRVHSAEQAVAMARAAQGDHANALPARVEANQDFWIVRLGPDQQGKTHNYLITIWDKQAGPLIAERTIEGGAIDLP